MFLSWDQLRECRSRTSILVIVRLVSLVHFRVIDVDIVPRKAEAECGCHDVLGVLWIVSAIHDQSRRSYLWRELLYAACTAESDVKEVEDGYPAVRWGILWSTSKAELNGLSAVLFENKFRIINLGVDSVFYLLSRQSPMYIKPSMPGSFLSSLHSSKICIFVIGMTKQCDWVLKPVLYIAYRFESWS